MERDAERWTVSMAFCRPRVCALAERSGGSIDETEKKEGVRYVTLIDRHTTYLTRQGTLPALPDAD